MTSTAKAYRIQEDPICGRQLVTTRKIVAGEVIIDEPALLSGPSYGGSGRYISYSNYDNQSGANDKNKINNNKETGSDEAYQSSTISNLTMAYNIENDDYTVCLVCCANITSLSKLVHCPNCCLALCSELCQNHELHKKNECVVFPKIQKVWELNRDRSKKSFYNLIITIRALFYKFRDANKWDQLRMLESKSEALRKAGLFFELEDVFKCLSWDMFSSSWPPGINVNDNININQNKSGCFSSENDDIVESAQHCLGVIRINAFSNFTESYSREGLFFLSSLMSHSCFINTDRQMESCATSSIHEGFRMNDDIIPDSSRMVVRASVDIEKYEPITTTYLSLLYNTEERHRIMIISWLFMCQCRRCNDPTEFQTFAAGNFNDDIISRNKSVIQKIIQTRPNNLHEIHKIEDWLDQYDNGELLHPYHSVFTHVKLFLCQYYGRQSKGLDQLSVEQLKRKVLYCQQILTIYDKVAPGIQMCRGVILFELWCGLSKLHELKQLPVSIQQYSQTQILFEVGYINKIKLEALNILKYALPRSSEESMMKVLQEDDDLDFT